MTTLVKHAKKRRNTRRKTLIGGVIVTLQAAGAIIALGYTSASELPELDALERLAISTAAADQYVSGTSTGFVKGEDEKYSRQQVTPASRGLTYVTYSRTYKDLPVFVGGEAVVVTDSKSTVRSSTAGSGPLQVSTSAKVSAKKAKAVALGKHEGTVRGEPTLGVIAEGDGRLVWEVVVSGDGEHGPSVAHAFVDGQTGAYVGSWDEVARGTGNGHYNEQVHLDTTGSAGRFELRDPTRGNMRTLNDAASGSPFTDADDVWGNGVGSDLVTGAVDTQYAGAAVWDMLKEKFSRNGIDDAGRTATMFVGLPAANAYYACAGTGDASRDQTKYGRTTDRARQVNSVDVVAHELGHGIFCHTPGGSRGITNETGGLNEGTGDIFGALAEHFVANPNDPADYLVGEEVNLSGRGPIRTMYDPSKNGDPNCWSTDIPRTRVHSAAGPLNHWFYLAAEGSKPAGKPASPTCNGTDVTGIGLWQAGEIYYHALLRKTSGWTYTQARKATLDATRELYPNSCAEFNMIKAAWNAVSVPAQGDPTCTTGTPTPTASPSAPGPSSSPTSPPGGEPAAAPDIDGAKVEAHLEELGRIAAANGGSRAHGTAGYRASLDYVKGELDAAGYNTRIQQFNSGGKPGFNLIADLPDRGDHDKVVMLGAHLDSVDIGPGINDNGSGSAGILEVALTYAASGAKGDKSIRFGWWGAEEDGLVGSKAYVTSLSAAERESITAYLNFDMIGSPNPGYFVYNDDAKGDFITEALEEGFAAEDVPSEGVSLRGRSDHAPFMAVGIPSGGTATLSLVPVMSRAQAAKWNGKAGQPFDPCYHRSCDTVENISTAALDTHTDVAAYAAWKLTGVQAAGGSEGSTHITNNTHFPIRDRSVVESPITVQRDGPAQAVREVKVDIVHSYRGNLEIHLLAPDGTEYLIKRPSRLDRADDVKLTKPIDSSAEKTDGTWKLRVRDLRSGDIGTLRSWSLIF